MAKIFEESPEGMRLIRNVQFYDTPRGDGAEDEDKHSSPYVPSEVEWVELKADITLARLVAAFSMFFGAVSLIVAIGALALK
jgi:hypothetical protein